MLNSDQLKAWKSRQGMTNKEIGEQWVTSQGKPVSPNYISGLINGSEVMTEKAYEQLCRILANGKKQI